MPTAKLPNLNGVSPRDEVFLLAQQSESAVSPPSLEDTEALRMLKLSYMELHGKADDEQAIMHAESVENQHVLLNDDAIAKKAEFDAITQCIAIAGAAEKMELGAKKPNLVAAGAWKFLKIKLMKRTATFDEQQRVAAQAAASAALKRKAGSPPAPAAAPAPGW